MAYASSADLDMFYDERLIDQFACDDDTATRDAALVTRALEWGARKIYGRLRKVYTDAQINSSDVVKDLNCELAWVFLRRRKDHPDVERDFKFLLGRLRELVEGDEILDTASRVMPSVSPEFDDGEPADPMSGSSFFDGMRDTENPEDW